jgi:nitrite reductase/ring-hydroxylating ferredoxin subunit
MPNDEDWVDVGHADEFAATPLKRVTAMNIELAISFRDGKFGAISNACNHAGGPLGEGRLDGDYVICPWHNWKFHRCSGVGEPGFEEDRIPSYPIKIENGRVFVNLEAGTKRQKSRMTPIRCRAKSNAHQGLCASPVLQRRPWTPQTPASRVRIICSARALKAARGLNAETRLIKLNDLKFRNCEGYYSKSAQACTWPCSITQMDAKDQMDQVYEALVHWADAIIVSTPIRWGAASSLYFKMAERLNCVQNAVTIRNRVLIRNKVAGFIVVGGQDNIQAVAGQMLGFFAELVLSFRNFLTLPIRAAGRTKTWNATSRSCAPPRNWPMGRQCSPRGVSSLRLILFPATKLQHRSNAAAARRTPCIRESPSPQVPISAYGFLFR